MSAVPLRRPTMRVAVEGCGHGTLHSIYASLEESCGRKGWDGVDVLIICGDFQAVRNRLDLNVTAMPQKFRKMADFHEYYSGVRSAPYLTIFIGGNHEASNHLFELYYGGWVAPNIYYMGAANVLRLGPLRIAGLSGIWKGYDYRKPHFERLPYNQDDINSIYHVRELDVRKLLTIRSQVDIGLSHDWPQEIEWKGDYNWLFRKKDQFEADSRKGHLGSVAAKQCLHKLRPAYWFSAHLHIRYPAIIQHDAHEPVRTTADPGSAKKAAGNQDPNAKPMVSAWQNFHTKAVKEEAEETRRVLQEWQERKEEEDRTGIRTRPQYVYDETFKQVSCDNNLGREITSVTKSSSGPTEISRTSVDPMSEDLDHKITTMSKSTGDPPEILHTPNLGNLDGCTESKLSNNILKRRRDSSITKPARNPDEIEISDEDDPQMKVVHMIDPLRSSLDATMANSAKGKSSAIKNEEEIDVDLSDSSGENDAKMTLAQPGISMASNASFVTPSISEVNNNPTMVDATEQSSQRARILSDDDEDGGVRLNPNATAFVPMAPTLLKSNHSIKETIDATTRNAAVEPRKSTENDVSDELRTQLANLSSNFAAPLPQSSSPLALPAAICNKTTQFLALDKCEPNREFLQLLEIEPISKLEEISVDPPFKLQYDKEWLAISRVFGKELELGGRPTDTIPPHQGELHYRNRVLEEEAWIEEHVVQHGLLNIPESFSTTAPPYDPELIASHTDMPREVSNPQTSAFCQLIGIENQFDISEKERDERILRGPRPNRERNSDGRRGGGGGRGGNRGRGGGFRGGRGAGARGGRGGRGGRSW